MNSATVQQGNVMERGRRWAVTWKIRLLLLACLATLVSTESAHGQDTLVLSLAAARGIAREHNPQYRATLNDVGVATARVREAWGAFLPEARADIAFGGSESRIVTGRDEFGNPVRRDDPLNYTASTATQGVSLGLEIFDGGARWSALRAMRASSRAATERASDALVHLDADVARRYYEALRSQSAIALAESQLGSARAQLEATKRLFRVAGASQVDVLGAEVDVATRAQELQRALGDAEKAKLVLREILGIERSVPVALSTPLPRAFDPDSLSVDSLVAQALRDHPRIGALVASRDAAKSELSVVRASRWPTIMVNALLSRSISRPDYGSLLDFNPPDRSLSFAISASLPLFDQFHRSAAGAQAQAARNDADLATRAARLEIERSVRSAFIDLGNSYRGLRLAEHAAQLSRQRADMAREQYRLGAIPFTTLQAVIDRGAASERAELDARFAFAAARVALEEQVGSRLFP